jgi:FolB domain-containing protein
MTEFLIEELKQEVILGWPESERAHPQLVSMNVRLSIPRQTAGETDDIEGTVNYIDVIRTIGEKCQTRSWKLLEAMTREICIELLARFTLVDCVRISVRKNIIPASAGVTLAFEMDRSTYDRITI